MSENGLEMISCIDFFSVRAVIRYWKKTHYRMYDSIMVQNIRQQKK